MTERELLELAIRKITGMEQKVTGIEQKITGMEQKITGMEQDVKLIKTQQSEHGEMIQSLVHASEVQKAQHDALQIEVAKLSGEMNKGFLDITEIQKSLLEMYGDHEAKIRILQRKPV